ncbi:MAG: hypothetical protein MJ172_07265 [Clostridia bacterium]|nr:hypothetical protein [Clostridia bacterium]
MEDSSAFGTLLIIALIIYIVSPIDFLPGPVDDIVLALIAMASKRQS